MNGVSNRSIAVTIIICISLVYVSYTFNVCLMEKLSRTFQKYPLRNLLSTEDAFSPTQNITSNSSVRSDNVLASVNQSSFSFLKILGSFVRIVPFNDSQKWTSDVAVQSQRNSIKEPIKFETSTLGALRHKRNNNSRYANSLTVSRSSKYRLLHQSGSRLSRHLPDTLIIGVKKSGTRALLEFIRLHPFVRAVGYEVHFFDKNYGRGLHWYRRHMPYTIQGQVTMEKTPSYFITKEVPKRVHQMNPAMRLLVVVRDPVTRAISDYTQAASKKADMKRFEDLAFVNNSYAVVDTSWGPVKIGVYARYLERWLQYFPLSQLLFVSGERLIIDPAFEIGRVQDFLGLKRIVTEKHFYFNATKGFPCLFKSEARSTPHCLGKTKGRNHPFIDPAAIDRLREFYKPFNNKFYEMTGIDFEWPSGD